MTPEEVAILDRVERLAFLAGLGQAKHLTNNEQPQKEIADNKPPVEVIRDKEIDDIAQRIRALCQEYSLCTGVVYFSNQNSDNNLTWEMLHTLAAKL